MAEPRRQGVGMSQLESVLDIISNPGPDEININIKTVCDKPQAQAAGLLGGISSRREMNLLTPQEVAGQLQVSARTVTGLGLPCLRIGVKGLLRFRQEDVDAWIASKLEYAETTSHKETHGPEKAGGERTAFGST